MNRQLFRSLVLSAALILLSAGCASTVPIRPLTPAERVEKEGHLGKLLAENFEPHLKLKQDIEVSVYLRKLAETLIASLPTLKNEPIGVITIGDHDESWRSFGFPGNRVYLPAGMLRVIQYENELAALLSVELAHLELDHAFAHYETSVNDASGPLLPSTLRYFGPGGIFSYSDEENEAATELAVGILYRAGFDARGVVALWENFRDHPEKSPYDQETLARLLERTRSTLAFYSPLRNPVVRSEAFIKVQKRIQKL